MRPSENRNGREKRGSAPTGAGTQAGIPPPPAAKPFEHYLPKWVSSPFDACGLPKCKQAV